MTNRRDFIKKVTLGTAGVAIGSNTMLKSSTMGMSAKSYSSIIGANDKINVAILGLGRRLSGFYAPISEKQNNIHLSYLCDVMKSQRENAGANFAKYIDYKPKLENDLRKIIDDPKVDAIMNATPDHWHTPSSL
ncbi:MAG: twin-arginine translocation signal domain-containing protein, partial [Dysgonamonadaceae bacterium]|nr:twin-arginine translocation signal domain-containing protein [Dysgonamonadaceae bacterium]